MKMTGVILTVMALGFALWAYVHPPVRPLLGYRVPVEDQDGNPVAGAEVIGPDGSVRTNNRGIAAVPRDWLNATVRVRADGYRETGPTRLVLADDETMHPIILMK